MTLLTLLRDYLSKGVEVLLVDNKLKIEALPEVLKLTDISALKNHKASILKLFNQLNIKSSKDCSIPSFSQQRLWLLDKIDGGSTHYNMPGALRLTGALDLEALTRAINTIIARHESLRTCFVEGEGGEPIQVIQPVSSVDVPVIDISSLPESERETALSTLLSQEASTPFDLSTDRMLRAQVVKVDSQSHVLLVTMHHIASDGWSMGILVNEFSALYQAYVQGEENPLAPLAIQYADYAHWQREWLQGEVLDAQMGYWQEQLSDLPVVHSLPLDKVRPKEQTFNGAVYHSVIESSIQDTLNNLCHEVGGTLFMGLHAAFSVLLSRYSNETDIVVGSPIANREQAEVEALIGFFVNTLVLRSDLSGNPSFHDLLKQSKATLLNAYAHQQVPFEQLVEVLQPERSTAHSPLFQVMLALQNNEEGTLELPGLTLSPVEQSGGGVAQCDLTLNVTETVDGLQLGWEYNTDLFTEGTITRLASHFDLLLTGMVNHPDDNVFCIDMLSAEERHQQLVEWNDTTADFPRDRCIHQLFEQQVAETPDAIAVVFEESQVTYGELNARANQLAHYLIEVKGVAPDTLVGICVERSIEMIVGILGILKAGGAYVPLDPSYPEARLEYMLDDADLTTVLLQARLAGQTPVSDSQALYLDSEAMLGQLSEQPTTNPVVSGLISNHLAYVIYTSGSTGNPKGVMVEHKALHNRIHWMDDEYGCTSADKALQKTPFSFDVSVWEFFWPLSVGAQLVFARPEGHKDPAYLAQLIRMRGVTILHFVPSMLSHLLESDALSGEESLTRVFCSGEALSPQHVTAFYSRLPQTELHNLYGPTEAAIDVSHWSCTQSALSTVPIGKAIDNTQLHILNNDELAPVGVIGELHIGGLGLARGYLNQPGLTDEKFIANPFYDARNPSSSERLYKTGDLVRYLPDGNIEFLGRIDHQVKVRGFRIELGEIEHQLLSQDTVNDAVVVALGDESDKRLVAYVTHNDALSMLIPEGEAGYEGAHTLRHAFIDRLKSTLGHALPDYMVPSAFVVLEQLPLTPNGKIDRKALPAPDMALQQDVYVAPTTDTEKRLCEIWQEVLGLEQVGVTDNFFALGGHSLLVMNVIAKAQQIGMSIMVKAFFAHAQLSGLAQEIDSDKGDVPSVFTVPDNLIPADCQYITPEMLPLVNLTQTEIDQIATHIPGGVENIEDIYPLGPLQEGILFTHCVSDKSDPYITTSLFEVNGQAAVDDLINGLQFVIDRHDVLRTAVLWEGLETPLQVVCRAANLPVTWLSLDEDVDVESHMHALSLPENQWMALTQAPLIKLSIAQGDKQGQYFVLLQYHHIISDHIGLEIIHHELAMYSAGQQDELAPTVPYRDFIAHTLHQAQTYDAQGYFTDLLGDVSESTAPFDLLDVQGDGTQIVELREAVPAEVARDIRTLSKSLQVSPASLFHSAFGLVVGACSGRDDVVFGSIMSGRLQGITGSEAMPGVFINTLPVRLKMNGSSVLDYVLSTHRHLRDLLPFEQAPLALAQRCSGLENSTPLFSAMLNYRHSKESDGVETSEAHSNDTLMKMIGGQERTNYPFSISVDDFGVDFGLDVQVDNSVDIARVMSYMQTALGQLVECLTYRPEAPVNQLSVLPDSERHQQVVEWNDTTADFPRDMCIHQLFEQQVAETPDAIAVVFEESQVTYGELNARANQLAHYLIEVKGVTSDTLVGICVERSVEMIVGILGILKAGGAYVPLDPSYPEARLQYMLDDADLTTVLLQARLAGQTPVSDSQALYLDSEAMLGQLSELPTTNPVVSGLISNHLAYVIYTSGSTGNPKGVMVEHKALTAHILSCYINYQLVNKDNVLQFSTINFDLAQEQIFSTLTVGAKLCLLKTNVLSESEFFQVCKEYQLTIVDLTPNYAQLLFNYSQQKGYEFEHLSIRLMIVGAEPVPKTLLMQWQQIPNSFRLINAYGPTETVVTSTMYEFNKEHIDDVVSIGRATAFRQGYVCSGQMDLLPIGVAGELHIGGLGLARGYLNQPGLTDEKFIENPFYDSRNPSNSERLYKTGDLVRYLPDGNIEFLGRIDHQVKVRGFRIELGEIEHQLLSQDTVNDAVVVVLGDDDDKSLVAYVTHDDAALMLEDGDKAQTLRHEFITSLRDALHQHVPDYMVPSAFVVLEQLPLTPNGKIDRKALPAPDMALQQKAHVAPTTDTEKRLCEIWQEVLGLEQVGVTDNFFALGGHSLLVMNVIAKAQQIGVSITVKAFFAHAQLSGLAQEIDSDKGDVPSVFTVPDNLIPADCQYITPEMLPLVNLTQTEIDQIATHIPGGVENIEDIYPLGPLQEGILFAHRVSDKSDPYITTSLFEVNGQAAVDDLINGLQFVIDRHDVLRTAVLWEGLETPLQVVCRAANLPVTWLSLDEDVDVESHMHALSLPENQWMALTQAPLIKLSIAQGDKQGQYFVLLQIHHMNSDHVGIEIIHHELAMYSAGQQDELAPTVPYRDFIAHALHQAQTHDAQGYFTDLLGDVSESTAPFDLLDVQGDGTQIVELREAVPAEVARDIRTLSKSLQVSPASLFHSAFGLVVGACSGRDDVVFGSVMSGRLQGVTGSEAMPGVFINTLPVRLKMNGSSVLDYVLSTHRHLRDLLPFEQAPLALAQRCSGLENSTPLFSAMFNYRHSKESDGVEASEAHSNYALIKVLGGQERSNYPFGLNVDDFGSDFWLDFQVDNSIDITRVMSYMQTALGQLVECLTYRPEAPVNQLSVLPDSERHQQVVEWNATAADFPRDRCIHQLFEQQVAETPDAIAVVFEESQVTYGELNARANQLAHYLIEVKGVTPDTLVGICVERSIEMIVGILGILKAGGAYVPLDPSYPEARLEYMLDDADLTTVLLQARLAGQTPVSDSQALYLDSEAMLGQLSEQPTTNPVVSGLISNHLAYVIYTSGSTGNPKGVMVEHKSLVNLICFDLSLFELNSNSLFLHTLSLGFDAGNGYIFDVLSSGGTIHLINMFSDLCSYVDEQKISHLVLPAARLNNLEGHFSENLRYLISGGESIQPNVLNKRKEIDNLFNVYGPTESTVTTTFTKIMLNSLPSIGKPIGNAQCYVINKAGQLLPIGAVGELHIGGLGLARGYLNQPGLTDEKFIANPFYDARNPSSSERLYKTGDLVRYLPDGNIEFLGRIDHQVKVRGFRIELGEIEHQLLSQNTVNDAVVVALGDDDDKRLVAYVTHNDALSMLIPEGEAGYEGAHTLRHAFIDSLKSTLGHALPDYMVPSAFVVLEQLPLTPNGKIDRKALPAPDMALQQDVYVAPTTDTEKRLCEIWQEVLGLEQVGVTDNFFELGGHSLLATRLITAVNIRLEIDVPLRVLFNCPTIATFSAALSECSIEASRPVIVSVSREHDLSLSFAQQRLWLLDKIDGGSTHYNMPGALRLTGALDLEALTRAINTIIARHESLRTCFVEGEGGEPIQVIQPVSSVDVPVIDISSLPESERETALSTLLSQEASTPFDLSTDRMLRAQVVKVDSQSHVLLVTMHHIASDGWSMGILVNEFSALYQAYVQGEENPLAPLAIQYADYAHWQREWLQGEVLDAQMGYWQEQLSDLPVVHSLPLDKVRPKEQTFNGAVYHSVIESSIQDTLNNLCHEVGGTLFMGLHAAFSVLLSRYSNETDIVVGSPIANREQAEVEALIGFFVNTLVLRSDLSGNPSFHDLLKQSKATLLNAYAHQQVPFEQLVEVLQPERSTAHSPLFQVMLALQNNEEGTLELPGLTLSPVEQSDDIAKYDLTLSITETVDGLQLGWEYNTDLFTEGTITRLASHFDLLLTGMVNHPDDNVFCIDMLSAEERHQQLVEWNDTTADFPRDRCIHQLFEQQVAETPDAIAVVFEESQVTYGELNARANQLAHYLIEVKGVAPDTLVGICVERSIEMIVGILGILKAGGAYVPLDRQYGTEIIKQRVQTINPHVVLTSHASESLFDSMAYPTVNLQKESAERLTSYSRDNIAGSGGGDNLAYVLTTSGSTGAPKLIGMPHQALVNLIEGMKHDCVEINAKHSILQLASIGFDMSFTEVCLSLLQGGLLHLPKQHEQFDVRHLSEQILVSNISLLNLPYAVLQALSTYSNESGTQYPSLSVVLSTAEQLIVTPDIKHFFARHNNTRLVNHYGPTETHVCTSKVLFADSDEWLVEPPIGKPMSNVRCYVLDDNGELLPSGAIGELCVGGLGLASGYLGDEVLTAEKFISNPFTTDVNRDGRLYKTGDLVKWSDKGELIYVGRADTQVKVRGFRVELGAIEGALAGSDMVNEACVLFDEIHYGLIAYITVRDDCSVDLLESELGAALPDYMVPDIFIEVGQFALTVNGKIDKKALPKVDASLLQKSYVAPTTETEKRLCEIWQEVLGLEQVGVTDNFFALGGHSLLATKLMANIHNQLGVDVPLRVLFNCPTIATFSAALSECSIEASRPVIVSVSREHDLSLSFAQQRLWLLDKIDGGSTHYNMPGALRLTGALDLEALTRAINTIIARHESLRTCFVEGEGGEPIQVIQPVSSVDVPVIDISSLPESERETALSTLLSQEASTPFDLSTDRMLRAQVVKVDSQSHVLLVTMHHIASDGWSMGILVNEFSALYQAYVQGEENPLAPLAIQYADYAHWQREWLQGEVLDAQMGYWQEQLSDLPVVHSLPLDKVRPKEQTFNGAVYHSVIESSIQDTLNNLCHEVGGTLFMGLHAAFSVLLSRYSNETDIVVGSPIANREQAEVEALIGFFVNTLVLRSDLSGNPSFHDLLKQSKATLLNAYAHQQVPFEQLVEVLQPERSTAHSPLFQVMLALQNNEEGTLELPGLTLSPVEQSGGGVAQCDLTLNVTETVDGLQLGWEYNTDLFTEGTITRLASHFDLLLTGMVNHPDDNVFCIDMLSAEERHQQLVEWNDTTADFPRDRCIHQLFEQQVAETPDAIAVVFGEQSLSYSQFDHQATCWSAYLQERGVKPGTVVGIYLERSLCLSVAIWSVLKSGGCFVLLDPSYPASRLEYLLEDSGAQLVLSDTVVSAIALAPGVASVLMDEVDVSGFDDSGLKVELSSTAAACIFYTSGSTGKPKGSVYTHRNVVNYSLSMIEKLECTEADRVLQMASVGFDVVLEEVMPAWLCGACVVFDDSHGLMGIPELQDLLASQSISCMEISFAQWREWLYWLQNNHTSPSEHLRVVMVGCDSIPSGLMQDWLAYDVRLLHVFGLTETTITSSVWDSRDWDGHLQGVMPIGQPIGNTQLYILDGYQRPQPVGVSGELYIGGAGVTEGYLNRPALTQQRFVPNPFSDVPGDVLYRTGDLARYLPDGNVVFIGRGDEQVKIRGFRIELGEIEYQLLSQDTVNDAVVVALGDDDDKRLVAYVTHNDALSMLIPEGEAGYEGAHTLRHAFIDSLKSTLGHALPDYMVPSAFVVLEQLPLTPNGKIDRKALPAPDMALQKDVYVAPTTDTEKRLCEIWQEVLGLEQVGVTDNFFALGGHSLLATKLAGDIKKYWGINIEVKTIFQKSDIQYLCQLIDKELLFYSGFTREQSLKADVWEL